MNRFLVLRRAPLVLVAVLSTASSLPATIVLSDFDDGTMQGWSMRLPFGGTLTNPGTSGNPGGYLLVTDDVPLGGGLWVVAPGTYTGNLSMLSGLQWDEFVFVRGAGGSATEKSTELFLTGGPNDTTYRMADNPLTLIGQWHTRFVEFNAENFTLSNGIDSFEMVIRNVTELSIQMDTSTLANGGPESGIDNVRLVGVPEPSSWMLCVLAALCVSFPFSRQTGTC